MSLWEFRELTASVRAGLVPALCGATTRVARTPRNPKELIFFLLTEMKHTLWQIALPTVKPSWPTFAPRRFS